MGWMRDAGRSWESISLILLLALSLYPYDSGARTGYCIDVSVDNVTRWSRCQSSQEMVFSIDSSCKGDGNFSKYMRVSGIAGIELKELTSADQGRLIDESKMKIESDSPTIYIVETARNNSSLYTARIEENFPAYITSNDDLYYRGKAIRNRNYYANNIDKAFTEYEGGSLTKSAKYLAARTNSLVIARIQAERPRVIDLTNYATAFRISTRTDRYASFRFQSDREMIDEEYKGSSRITLKAVKSNKFNATLIEDWLSCCPALEMPTRSYHR